VGINSIVSTGEWECEPHFALGLVALQAVSLPDDSASAGSTFESSRGLFRPNSQQVAGMYPCMSPFAFLSTMKKTTNIQILSLKANTS
jgi:hypothetical protein